MSREIKFRAWDAEQKRWATDKITLQFGWQYKDQAFTNDPNPTGLVIVQYTGLKDKNGKEIYEGDIVRFGAAQAAFVPLEQEDYVAPVVYNAACFTVDGNALIDVVSWHKCEVIGNIYENKEALRGE